jgi:hypothetical protein
MGFGGGDKIFNNMLDRVRCAAALRPRKLRSPTRRARCAAPRKIAPAHAHLHAALHLRKSALANARASLRRAKVALAPAHPLTRRLARPQVMVPMAFMSPFAVLFIYVWDSGTVKYDKKLTVGGEPLKYSKE